MTFEEYVQDFEGLKKTMSMRAWFVLSECLVNGTATREQVDVAKYLLNRFEGMPTEKKEIESKGNVVFEVVNYEQLGARKREDPLFIPPEMVSTAVAGVASEIQGSCDAPQVGEDKDDPESADRQGSE